MEVMKIAEGGRWTELGILCSVCGMEQAETNAKQKAISY
jgi:hypothetical protein